MRRRKLRKKGRRNRKRKVRWRGRKTKRRKNGVGVMQDIREGK